MKIKNSLAIKDLLSISTVRQVAAVAVCLLLAGRALGTDIGTVVDTNGPGLTAAGVLQFAAGRYAAMSAYADEGRIVSTVDGVTTTTAFITRLARPRSYLVEWRNTRRFFTTQVSTAPQAVYCPGAGDFLETGRGPQDEMSPAVALDLAASFSSGASAAIPMVFFRLPQGDKLGVSSFEETREADGQAAGVACYVLSSVCRDRRDTLWIGKKDGLIHQVRSEVGAEAMREDLAEAATARPELQKLLQPCVFTETLSNIVVNPRLSRRDFVPVIQHFADSAAR